MTRHHTFARSSEKRQYDITLILSILASSLGFVLAFISWLRICSEACSEGHNYRLYGISFEAIGMPFFVALTACLLASTKVKKLRLLTGAAVCGATGAELLFIYAQKTVIGHWCPVCLGIASAVFIVFALMAYEYFNTLLESIINGQKEVLMKSVTKGALSALIITMGFLFSQAGFAKFNQLQAAETTVKDSIAFGNLKSPIEIYVFTDWECPSCRNIEPVLEKSFDEITKNARLIFVDLPIHPESMNFTPYNLSFMIHDKKQYFKARDLLTELSLKTTTPTDEQVEAEMKKINVKYIQLKYADINTGIKYFQHLAKQFSVDRTPTVVIVNTEKKKGKKFIGSSEITAENLLKGIDVLSN